MDPKEIQAILEKAIASAVKPVEKDNKVDENFANIAKAVQAVSAKVDNLEKVAVKNEPETAETQIQKLAKSVEEIAKTIEAIKNPVKDEDKPMDFSKMTQKQFSEMIAGIVKPKSEETPKGKGKESMKSILDNAADEDEVDIDLSGIDTHDEAGNELTEQQRLARKNLDEYLGAKLGNLSSKSVGNSEEASEEVTDEE